MTACWMRSAAHAAKGQDSAHVRTEQNAMAGEIRLARPLGSDLTLQARLVLVLKVEPGLDYAEVCLLSNERGMMPDHDVLLRRQETHLPFDLVAQLDLAAPIYLIQACECFGQVDSVELLAGLKRVAAGDFSVPGLGERGTPIRGPRDPRWAFKEAELAHLQELSSRCANDVIEGRSTVRTVIDPALLDETIQRPSPDPSTLNEQLLLLSEASQGALASPDQIDALMLALEAQLAADPTLLVAIQPLLEAAISDSSLVRCAAEIQYSPPRESALGEADRQLGGILAALVAANTGALMRLLTSEHAWKHPLAAGRQATISIPGHEPRFAEACYLRRAA